MDDLTIHYKETPATMVSKEKPSLQTQFSLTIRSLNDYKAAPRAKL